MSNQSGAANDNQGQQTTPYHSGIPSPPNDSDGGQRSNYVGGNESGELIADNPLDLRLKLRFPSSSHLDVENQRLRTERVNSAYSPDQSEPSSPGKSTGI